MSTAKRSNPENDGQAGGQRRHPPCARCLKWLATDGEVELRCWQVDDPSGEGRCGRCLRLKKSCYTTETGALGSMAKSLYDDWSAAARLDSGAAKDRAKKSVRGAAYCYKRQQEIEARKSTRAKRLAAAEEERVLRSRGGSSEDSEPEASPSKRPRRSTSSGDAPVTRAEYQKLVDSVNEVGESIKKCLDAQERRITALEGIMDDLYMAISHTKRSRPD